MTVTTKYKLHPKQLEAYNFTAKYGATICGKRGGKTFVGALWAAKQISLHPRGVGLVAAPTNKILAQAALDTFFGLFPEYKPFYRKQAGELHLPEGGKVYFRSVDEPNAIEGITADWAWLDEAGQMRPEVWRIVRARVSTTKGQVFITTTPYTLNWLYTDLFIPWKDDNDPDIEIFRWATIENPVFKFDEEGKRFIETERKRLSEDEFSREFEGEFVKLQGMIYPEWNRAVHILPAGWKPDTGSTAWRSIDFGAHNPTACLWIHVNKQGEIIVFDEYFQSEQTTDYHAGVILSKHTEYDYRLTYGDPSGKQNMLDYAAKGFFITPAIKTQPGELGWVHSGINEIKALLKVNPSNSRPKLFVTENCVNLIREIENYRWMDKPKNPNQAWKDGPIKVDDHGADALRMFVVSFRTSSNRKRRSQGRRSDRSRSSTTGY